MNNAWMLLSSLSEEEKSDFDRFLDYKAPGRKGREGNSQVKRLYKFFLKGKTSKEAEEIFSEESSNGFFRRLCSLIVDYLEEYLVLKGISKKNDHYYIYLLEQLNQRDLSKLFTSTFTEAKKWGEENIPKFSEAYHVFNSNLQESYLSHLYKGGKAVSGEGWNKWYLHKEMAHAYFRLISWHNVKSQMSKEGESAHFNSIMAGEVFEVILNHLDTIPDDGLKLLSEVFHTQRLGIEAGSLIEGFEKIQRGLTHEDKLNTFYYLFNRINTDFVDFSERTHLRLMWYDLGLKHDLLFIDGYLHPEVLYACIYSLSHGARFADGRKLLKQYKRNVETSGIILSEEEVDIAELAEAVITFEEGYPGMRKAAMEKVKFIGNLRVKNPNLQIDAFVLALKSNYVLAHSKADFADLTKECKRILAMKAMKTTVNTAMTRKKEEIELISDLIAARTHEDKLKALSLRLPEYSGLSIYKWLKAMVAWRLASHS
jgi:hypothetical protein